jgi:hypothetical protein
MRFGQNGRIYWMEEGRKPPALIERKIRIDEAASTENRAGDVDEVRKRMKKEGE